MTATEEQQSGEQALSEERLYRNQYRCEVEDQSNWRSYGTMILMFILGAVVIYLALNLCKPLIKKPTQL